MEKTCSLCKKEFSTTKEDFAFYEKIQVPPPKKCPQCRLMQRLAIRNARTLYYRKCDFSGKEIISQYHAEHSFPVYAEDIWFSDKWDALEYGQAVDLAIPFFPQFKELKYKTPHFSIFIVPNTLENSSYTNCTGYLKNCYLISESDYNEDCYYSNLLKKCNNMADCSICYEDELCYECIDCMGCYNLKFSQDCQNCRDSSFLYNCQACHDCIGCMNQRHASYMVFNKQYSRENYEKMKEKLQTATSLQIKELWKTSISFFQTQIHKFHQAENVENCTGDHLYNSKNAFYCFDSKDLEDCRYCAKVSLGVKSSMDYNSWGDNAELIYQSAACGNSVYNLKFCTTCTTNNSNLEYCDQCTSCSDCFGCVGLKKKQYCILNKQFAKKEYVSLRQKLIQHMLKTEEYGEFFPSDINPFGYNETIAMDYFPLEKKEALALGCTWKEPDPKEHISQRYTIPANIGDVKDDITKALLACTECGKNYKIIIQELNFYRKMSVPVPEKCPTCRHTARMKKRNPAKLWERSCKKCNKKVSTSYDPQRTEIIYCEECFLSEVY